MTSAIRNISVIGTARASIENGSVVGVATADSTTLPKMTILRAFFNW